MIQAGKSAQQQNGVDSPFYVLRYVDSVYINEDALWPSCACICIRYISAPGCVSAPTMPGVPPPFLAQGVSCSASVMANTTSEGEVGRDGIMFDSCKLPSRVGGVD